MAEGANVGTAFVAIVPEVRGFGAQLQRGLNGGGGPAGVGKAFGSRMGGGLLSSVRGLGGPMTAALSVVGVGAVIKSGVELEKAFSQTMNTMGATANVPAAELEKLSALAMKLGADTSFSANEAADAMLELAKTGISPANIQAGALQGTLTLAAASGADLATSATIASTALNVFKLGGQQMNVVAAALSGGAAASSASVESLGEALGYVGPVAAASGFSLQETVAALSALDQAGIKGSSGGTNLRGVIAQLSPTTKKARIEMEKLHLTFTDSKGSFNDIATVSQKLQDALGGKSESERLNILTRMFGRENASAALALMAEGRKGMEGYIKATSDMDAANRVAKARMDGTAGALERMGGAVETAKLGIGKLFAPAVVIGADLVGKAAGAAASGVDRLMKAAQGGGGSSFLTTIGAAVTPAVRQLQAFGQTLMPIVTQGKAQLIQLGSAFATMGRALLPTLQAIGTKLLAVLGPAIRSIGGMITGQLLPAFNAMLPVVTPVVRFLLNVLGGAVVGALQGAVNVIKGVLNIVIGVVKTFTALLTGNWKGAWDGIKQIVSGAFRAVVGLIQVYLSVGVLRVFKAAGAGIRAIWNGLWNGLKSLAAGGVSLIQRVIMGGLRLVLAPFRALASGAAAIFRGGMNIVKGVASGALSALKGLFTGGLRAIGTAFKFYIGVWLSIVRNGTGLIRGIFSAAMGAIKGVVTGALGAVRGAFSAGFGALKGIASNAMSGMRSAVSTGLDTVVGFFTAIPGRITGALSNVGGSLLGIGQNIVGGLVDGIRNSGNVVANALVDLLPGPLKKFADKLGIASPSLVFREFGRYVVEGFAKGIHDTANKAEYAINRLGVLASRIARERGTRGLRQFVTHENRTLQALLDQRVKVVGRIAAVQAAIKAAPVFAKEVRGNVLQGVDITSMGGEVAAVQERLNAAVANTKAFARNLAALRKRGLNRTALSQIIAAGVDQGGATAQGLARATDVQLAGINRAQIQLTDAATTTGRRAAEAMYGAGGNAAKGLVAGLAKQQKSIEAQMMRIAVGMRKAIKHALGIKSPSTVFAGFGGDVADGLALGIAGGAAQVTAATQTLAGAATLSGLSGGYHAPSFAAGGAGAGTSITVHADVRETADVTMLINRLEFETRAGSFG